MYGRYLFFCGLVCVVFCGVVGWRWGFGYSLLLQCWRSNPVERPRFNQIADILSDMLNQNKTKSYVNMNILQQ
ncbi:hypothetical protein Avbf_13852 [Armadillidium vulgare]|nr:hypothetical protein Avbf_13852 [Armadillidium vulgare]